MRAEALPFDGPLPDPAQGVFETTLVTGGRPVALEAHLARLEASLAALYGLAVPDGARAQVDEAAAGLELGRLRLTVGSDGASERAGGERRPGARVPADGIAVAPIAVPGGIGPHKWADRRLLDQAEEQLAPALPLVVDAEDGAALESSARQPVRRSRGRRGDPAGRRAAASGHHADAGDRSGSRAGRGAARGSRRPGGSGRGLHDRSGARGGTGRELRRRRGSGIPASSRRESLRSCAPSG